VGAVWFGTIAMAILEVLNASATLSAKTAETFKDTRTQPSLCGCLGGPINERKR
jgi:hypothetical protein